jgi:antitoxin component of MazEF toxin-antitoxin module
MSSGNMLIEERGRTVSRSGGGNIIRIPSSLNEYVKEGDSIDMIARLEGKKLVIITEKTFFNFDLDEIKALLARERFSIKEDRKIGDVRVLQAEKDNLLVSGTKNILEMTSPAYVTLSFKKMGLNKKEYDSILARTKHLQKKFNVIARPEGDLDTINLLKNPKRYKMSSDEAVELIQKSGRKIGASLNIRFNNRDHILKDIESALVELSH